MKRKGKSKVWTNTPKKSPSSLILTAPLNQIYSQTNEKVIRNFKLNGLGAKKVPIKKIDLRVFCEKLPFESLFSNKS